MNIILKLTSRMNTCEKYRQSSGFSKKNNLEDDDSLSTSSSSSFEKGCSSRVANYHDLERKKTMKSLRTVAVKVANPQNRMRRKIVNILLDDGSNRSFIDKQLFVDLKLTGRETLVTAQGLNGVKIREFSTLSQIEITSLLKPEFKKTICVRTKSDLADRTIVVDWNYHKQKWDHLKNLVFPPCNVTSSVDIIVGNDYPSLLQSLNEVPGKGINQPYARLTLLGYTAIGPVDETHIHDDEYEYKIKEIMKNNEK